MNDNWYDTAQICLTGHVINPASVGNPVHNKRFCDVCGKGTVTTCKNCSAPIRGTFHSSGDTTSPTYNRPGFCHNCSSPFPWYS